MLSGYFNIRSLLDAIRVSTLLHFCIKNPPTSLLGGVLGRLVGVLAASWAVLEASWAVLGRLGGVLGRLGGILGRLRPSWRRLGGVLGRNWRHLGPSW